MTVNKRVIINKKRKSTAIILAVFFGPLAWTYTWKFDKAKFWAGLIIDLILFWTIIVPIGITIWAIIDMSVKDNDMFENYHKYKVM